MILALTSVGCARTIVDRAIRARGGELVGVTREVNARVYQGMPGDWSWELAYRAPRDLRWTLHTWGEEQSYVFADGRAIYTLGTARLPVPAGADESMLTQSRWLAVTSLDVLRQPTEASWRELPAAALPPAAVAGIEVRLRDGDTPYRLFFDAADRLIAAEGEISMPPIGSGLLRAHYQSFRDVDGYRLPYRIVYELDGKPFFDEEVVRYVVEPG